MKPKFSFIIPTLNEGKYLEGCLRSIKKQTRKDYEIIVVDSYSNDKTLKIAKKYRAKIVFEKRKGPAVARNTGARHAKGSILVFADADVRLEKDFLERVDKKFSRDVGGGIFFLVVYDTKSRFQALLYSLANYISISLIALHATMTAGSCFAYDKKIFREVGGFNPEFLTNEDHELAGRVSRIKRFAFFRDIHVYTSSRRIAKIGLLRTLKTYVKSSMIYFLNHGYLRDYWQG